MCPGSVCLGSVCLGNKLPTSSRHRQFRPLAGFDYASKLAKAASRALVASFTH